MQRRFAPWQVLLVLLALGFSHGALAFVVNIAAQNPRAMYLRVGDGAFTGGNYQSGGSPADLATVNAVSVSVGASAVGSGLDQPMTGNASQLTSNYDGFSFCNAGQVYIGGFYRRNGSGDSATLSVSSPAGGLVNGSGETIPFSQISWTSSGNASGGGSETGAQPIPAGAFSGGLQTLANFPVNTWRESCHTFLYGNDLVVAAGTYTGRVTYTLSSP